jgi:hypothetical protein
MNFLFDILFRHNPSVLFHSFDEKIELAKKLREEKKIEGKEFVRNIKYKLKI